MSLEKPKMERITLTVEELTLLLLISAVVGFMVGMLVELWCERTISHEDDEQPERLPGPEGGRSHI